MTTGLKMISWHIFLKNLAWNTWVCAYLFLLFRPKFVGFLRQIANLHMKHILILFGFWLVCLLLLPFPCAGRIWTSFNVLLQLPFFADGPRVPAIPWVPATPREYRPRPEGTGLIPRVPTTPLGYRLWPKGTGHIPRVPPDTPLGYRLWPEGTGHIPRVPATPRVQALTRGYRPYPTGTGHP